MGKSQSILFADSQGSSEADREGAVRMTSLRSFLTIWLDKILQGPPLNSFCTVDPQVFHTPVVTGRVGRPRATLQYLLLPR